jgi:methionyl-tRNA formyltransferase
MATAESAAFFGLEADPYSQIALTHLRAEFASVVAFMGNNEVPPRAPDPGELEVDWLFCFKSKTIFRDATLKSLRKGAVNFHTAAPCYPGSGGVNWVLYNDDAQSAITVHRITPAIDAGPIIEVASFACDGADTVAKLLDLTYQRHLLTFIRITSRIAAEGLHWVQTAEAAYNGPTWAEKTYRLRDLEDLKRIDPAMPAVEVARRIKATRYQHYGPYVEIAGQRFSIVS